MTPSENTSNREVEHENDPSKVSYPQNGPKGTADILDWIICNGPAKRRAISHPSYGSDEVTRILEWLMDNSYLVKSDRKYVVPKENFDD